MKIGIVGGTGGMGKGFAIRWCNNHDVLIGSRDATKAIEAANEYSKNASELYGSIKGTIIGKDNLSVAKESDVLVLSIPYENIDSTCSQLLSNVKDNCIVISPIVPLTKTDAGFEFISFIEKKLIDPKLILDSDIFVCGDDQNSIDIVNGLIMEIKSLRPVLLGPGSLSYLAEIATPILLNAMIKNKMKNPGIKII